MVLDLNPFTSDSSERHPGSKLHLRGPHFSLPEILFHPGSRKSLGDLRRRAKRILIHGTSEVVCLAVLRWLAETEISDLSVDIVTRNLTLFSPELEKFKSQCSFAVRSHRAIDRTSSLSERADLAITDCEEIANVLVGQRTPLLFASTASNSNTQSKRSTPPIQLYDTSKGNNSILNRVPSPSSFLKKIINSRDLRNQLQSAGQLRMDHQGPVRVCRQMLAELYEYRLATDKDAEFLFQNRNESESRASSFDQARISRHDNEAWLQTKIQSPDSLLWLVRFQTGLPLGFVSCDISNHGKVRVAQFMITLNSADRGIGHGTILIEKMSRHIIESGCADQVVVQLKKDRSTVSNAFVKAGYRPIAPTVVNGRTAVQFSFDKKTAKIAPVSNTEIRRTA